MATWQTSRLRTTLKRDEGFAFGPSASQIAPQLYLSNFFYAKSVQAMSADGITHVVSILESKPAYPPFLKGTLHIPLMDTSDTDILQHLEATTAFIKAAIEESPNNNVLVHCLMGISRSATVVCAYLVATTSMSADETIDFVREKRPIVCPNLGFRRQLETYSLQFYSRKSLAAKSVARMTGVSEGIAARMRKLTSRSDTASRGASSRTQFDAQDAVATVTVSVSSVRGDVVEE
ncbi:protein-tyrosine phosphatase-like protein [Cristinia sonorae]|uniref:Protein-tyrosine phosphatase-like protein n=1 Tax=Cristinia sonorae TaxID=1940300 RepID=A0A8K0XJU4_9AGAR|nr:protein-tyrosine phosphatase-like protein [Cristinia sonorae]